MSSSHKVLQKLLRSPKPRKKSDLLNQREYNLLVSTTFEEFLAENFTEDQLGKLCAAEWEQLQFHYSDLEKRSERNRKKIFAKAKTSKGPPQVRVRNVPAPTASATSVIRSVAVPVDTVEVPAAGDPVLESIENVIERGRESGRQEDRQIDELNVSLERIDLSRTMAPRHLLLEELVPPIPLPEPAELDLGPPNDAAAFFGSNELMPMDDPRVRELVIAEFPSLQRPQIIRQFEDLDEDLEARLMPPLALPNVPGTSGISSSTPIASDPKLRRHVLGPIELSSVKYPTPGTVDASLRSDKPSSGAPNGESFETPPAEMAAPDVSSIPHPETSTEEQPSSNVDSGFPTSTVVDSGPNPLPEPLPEPVTEPQAQVPAQISSSSSSSSDHPAPRPRRNPSQTRRVPEYEASNLIIRFQLRTTFPLSPVDDFSMFDTDMQLIDRLLRLRAAQRAAVQVAQRQVPQGAAAVVPVDDQQASLRDLSGMPYADLSSIRERPSATGAQLYPISERPQAEEREEQQSLSVVPRRTTVGTVGDGAELSALGMTGKGAAADSMLEPVPEPIVDIRNMEPPQILVTGTAGEVLPPTTTEPAIEKPVEEITPNLLMPDSVPIPAPEGQRPEDRRSEKPLLPATVLCKRDEKFAELHKLYLTINHATKGTCNGTISMEHLQALECTPRSKLSCAKLFGKLLVLKKIRLIETGVDERGRIRSVTVKS